MKTAASPGSRNSALRALTGKRAVAIGIGVAAIATVGAVAVGVATMGTGTGNPATGSSAGAPASTVLPPSLVEFRSPPAGFSLAYPTDWTHLQSTDPQVPLIATRGPHSFLVRVLDLPNQIGPQELAAARALTDGIVLSDKSVKLLAQPQQMSLAGLPGYFYFYTFTDPATGLTGVHSHFFLFKGKTMIALVFQAIPAEQFKDGATTFDQITGSFRVE